jgi:hypothetical protein
MWCFLTYPRNLEIGCRYAMHGSCIVVDDCIAQPACSNRRIGDLPITIASMPVRASLRCELFFFPRALGAEHTDGPRPAQYSLSALCAGRRPSNMSKLQIYTTNVHIQQCVILRLFQFLCRLPLLRLQIWPFDTSALPCGVCLSGPSNVPSKQ